MHIRQMATIGSLCSRTIGPRCTKGGRSGLTDEAAQAEVSYADMRGNPFRQQLGLLVLHVVNHGTHHRGQVSGFLRAMGHAPPKLDLVFYYREMEAGLKPRAG